MGGNLKVSLDRLPINQVELLEENGVERFPRGVGYDEKNVDLLRRIDFAWAVGREEPESKKQKKGSGSSKENQSNGNQRQSLVENLQLAHQELSVIIDLINTVEANDVVTVASMTKPKQLPNEHLSDLAVSTATKLQCFRHLGKYLKQSADSIEKRIAREARFYGALIRLQQNWKIKRLRNEGFYIDLVDNSLNDPTASAFRLSSISTVRIDRDFAGMLTANLPPNSCRSLQFGFLGSNLVPNIKRFSKRGGLVKDSSVDNSNKKRNLSDDDSVRETHALMREVHRAIADEQVFDLVNREAINPSIGVDVTGLQENFLSLNVGQGASVSVSLVPLSQDDAPDDNGNANTRTSKLRMLRFPNQTSFEIYLQQIFHEHVFVKAKNRSSSSGRRQVSNQQPVKNSVSLLGHFCSSLAHRIFSNKVVAALENLGCCYFAIAVLDPDWIGSFTPLTHWGASNICQVCRINYVHLTSQPSWHSRTSSWTLSVSVPQSISLAGFESHHVTNLKSEFRTKVYVNDACISVEGEGAPDVVCLFKGKPETVSCMNRYSCDLADLPVMLLQQIASQIIRWLHEEAMAVGMKSSRDFLSLSFELEQGEIVRLVSHVDPEDGEGCISWWLVMEDGFTQISSDGESDNRIFLGYPSLQLLHSTLLDLVGLCSVGGNNGGGVNTTTG